jgi:hypothetical protein
MDKDERAACLRQMLADLNELAKTDGHVAAATAAEILEGILGVGPSVAIIDLRQVDLFAD